MASSFVTWAFGNRITSAKLSDMASNGLPRLDTYADLKAAMPNPILGQRAWCAAIPITPGNATTRSCALEAKRGETESVCYWVPINVPLYAGRQVAAQSIPNNAYTNIGFDTVEVDLIGSPSTGGVGQPYSNIFRAPAAGVYRVSGLRTTFAGNATGYRALRICKNATPTIGLPAGTWFENTWGATYNVNVRATEYHVALAAAEEIVFQTLQASGVALSTTVSSQIEPSFTISCPG